LARSNIARKLLGEFREGENAGNKDVKIVGDIKKARRSLSPFGPKDCGVFFRKMSSCDKQTDLCKRLTSGVRRDLTGSSKPTILRIA